MLFDRARGVLLVELARDVRPLDLLLPLVELERTVWSFRSRKPFRRSRASSSDVGVVADIIVWPVEYLLVESSVMMLSCCFAIPDIDFLRGVVPPFSEGLIALCWIVD